VPTDVQLLLPDLLATGLVVVLMLLEILRVGERWARVTFAAGVAAALAACGYQLVTDVSAVPLADELRIDRVAVLAKTVALTCGLTLALGFPSVRPPRFWLLVACSVLGATVVAGSAGFATFFMGLEILSLPAFALIVLDRGADRASEGALKYLVLSSVASALVLFGVAITYGGSGSLAIDEWARRFAAGEAQAGVGGLLITCGLFLKAAVFPFHAWAPDAYGGARLPVTAVLASLVKTAVVLALVRLVAAGPLPDAMTAPVVVLGLASIFYGNLTALAQRGLRRLLAYSSIAHAGYMLFALLDTTGARVDDLYWYALVYALGTLVACASAARLFRADDDSLEALTGRFREQPLAATLLAVAVLSLAGLPPFPGFFAKLLVFRSAIASGHLTPAVVAFAGSFFGLPYYVGIVVRLFRRDATPDPLPDPSPGGLPPCSKATRSRPSAAPSAISSR
jgi:NADH-quinone oxidoreductase subunit N